MKKFIKWTTSEINFLIEKYPTMKNKDIGKILGRNVQAVTSRAYFLKISKPKGYFTKIRRGELNPFFGKKHTSTTKNKIGVANSGSNPKISLTRLRLFKDGKIKSAIKKGQTLEEAWGEEIAKLAKKKMSKSKKALNIVGDKNPMWGKHHSKETKKKQRMSKIERWKDKEWVMKTLKTFEIKPNKPEILLNKLIQENSLPFNYVGDGKIWFVGEKQAFNPDFLSKNPKHIIEMFGDYWHNLAGRKERDAERLRTYAKYGYKTLIIWERELKKPEEVIKKIKEFVGA